MLENAVGARLTAYADGFRVGDFDAVGARLADDVTLDLVEKFRKRGRTEVGEYYSRYAASEQWTFAPAVVDGRAAMLVYDREVSLETPAYFVALDIERSEEHTSELQSHLNLVCRLLLEKKKKT